MIAPRKADTGKHIYCDGNGSEKYRRFFRNLKAPVVINMDTRKGVQMIVEDDYPVKYKVYDVLRQRKKGG